jgi:hypothetical protein
MPELPEGMARIFVQVVSPSTGQNSRHEILVSDGLPASAMHHLLHVAVRAVREQMDHPMREVEANLHPADQGPRCRSMVYRTVPTAADGFTKQREPCSYPLSPDGTCSNSSNHIGSSGTTEAGVVSSGTHPARRAKRGDFLF